jgi:AIPR protein
MSKLHVRHVRGALEQMYDGKIDLSDYVRASDSHRTKAFLSRALAALAVQWATDLAPDEAAKTIVDGTGDNGIDAIYIDRSHSRIILVQSKWDGSGDGTLGLGDARNFIAGFKDLTDEKYRRFNAKIDPLKVHLSDALDDASVTFTLIVATTGQTTLAKPSRAAFDDMLEEVNSPQPIAEVEILGLDESNSLGNTSVNESLIDTLTSEGENFWYFNNGVTILCDKVAKRPRGVSNRTYGDFALHGASVVNGAQTVASIYNSNRKSSPGLENARVWVRFISLEGCPPDFAKNVTRATNTQNTVDGRDFVALDPEQSRLRTELLLSLKKTYSIKRGDQQPSSQTGCTVTEAAVALACANRDTSLAVLAKSAVGRLWESTDRPPYTVLFNPAMSPYRLWRCVETMRAVDRALDSLKDQRDGRAHGVAVQGNRLILYLVFRALNLDRIDDPDYNWDAQLEEVPTRVQQITDALTYWVETEYANSYLSGLFKNVTKCRDLVEKVRRGNGNHAG